MAPRGRPHHQRASAGRLRADGDSVRDAQQVSAGDGLQPDVLWGQDSGASSDCLLLAAPLVPGDPGAGTGGNSVYHHHLHPEVMRADDEWSLLFSLANAYTCRTRANGCLDWSLQWVCTFCREGCTAHSDGGLVGF